MKRIVKVTRQQATIGGALVCSFVGGMIANAVKTSLKQKRKKISSVKKSETSSEPEIQVKEVNVVEKVVERPDMQQIYEGTWDVHSEDPFFDEILQKGKTLLDEIEESAAEMSGSQSAGEIALSVLTGIACWADNIDECREELIDLARTALTVDKFETPNGKTHRWSTTQHLIDDNREKTLEFCREIVAFADITNDNEPDGSEKEDPQ